jgi:hypothetical protein
MNCSVKEKSGLHKEYNPVLTALTSFNIRLAIAAAAAAAWFIEGASAA